MASKAEAEAEAEEEGGGRRRGLRGRFGGGGAGGQLASGAGGIANILATIVVVIAGIAAVILVLHIIFVLFKGNESNNIVGHIRDYADSLAGPFKDLFTFKNPKTNTLVNYGIAALVWVAVGQLIAMLLKRVGTR